MKRKRTTIEKWYCYTDLVAFVQAKTKKEADEHFKRVFFRFSKGYKGAGLPFKRKKK